MKRLGMESRRDFLLMAAGLAGIVLSEAASAADACFDPAKLPNAGMRRSLNFKPESTDPKKMCGTCAFFKPAGQGGCGTCAIFSGGPVAARSVCDSWAAKA